MKLLMHTCCAPCSIYCIETLRNEGIEPTLYWYNPNIHPYKEYEARRDTLKEYSKMININAIFEEDYGLKNFCKNVIDDLDNRCSNYCYKVRLEQTAKYAKEHGYDAITTTLFVSPYQKHEAIKNMTWNLYTEILELDLEKDKQKQENFGLYMQKYCGCIFSEEDRYSKQIKRDREDNINHSM